jgi:hypothetical protein
MAPNPETLVAYAEEAQIYNGLYSALFMIFLGVGMLYLVDTSEKKWCSIHGRR